MLELMLFMGISSVNNKNSWYLSIWSLALASLFSLFFLFSSNMTYYMPNNFIAQDSISSILVFLTLWISLMMIIASQSSVKSSKNSPQMFINFLMALNFILIVAFSLNSILWFYFFFEASLIPTLLLILGWGYQPERLQASMYMMIYTVMASLPLLLTILWYSSNQDLSSMLLNSSFRDLSLPNWSASFFLMLILLAFLVKLPMFSVHLWLPKAHVEAPVAGSMVLAAILLKLGGYGIIRMHQYFNPPFSFSSSFFMCLALWGGMLASVMCFRQIDFKALIAYSSVGHMSLMLAGVFSNSTWGWNGAIILMISHGFCSSALFSLANYTYEKSHSRSLLLSKGMLLLCPSLSLGWFLFSVMNMAGPPSINLLGEIMIFPAMMYNSYFLILPLALMSFLAALYSMYLYTATQHGGAPKYEKPFFSLYNQTYTLLILHWLPANFFILKSEMISLFL